MASRWVQLDVGGTVFRTTLNTVLSVPGTMLAKLCDPDSVFGDQRDSDNTIQIDRVGNVIVMCVHLDIH